MSYRSSVLTCHDDDGECAVCRFLSGDRSALVMIAVIDVLDVQLAEAELSERRMLRAFIESERGPAWIDVTTVGDDRQKFQRTWPDGTFETRIGPEPAHQQD